MQFLDGMRANGTGISAQTFNFYLQAIKQFCRWMLKNKRATESPLAHLDALTVTTDRRHDRCAYSVEALQRLLDAAYNGPDRCGRTKLGELAWDMTGPERAMLYCVAMETGLRSSELRSLTKSSFNLDADPQEVTVDAAYSKRRRRDTLPLRPDTAESLKPLLPKLAPAATVFKMPRKEVVARSPLRPDLDAAREKWLAEALDAQDRANREASDFLSYIDDAGRYRDFHALRHSCWSDVAT